MVERVRILATDLGKAGPIRGKDVLTVGLLYKQLGGRIKVGGPLVAGTYSARFFLNWGQGQYKDQLGKLIQKPSEILKKGKEWDEILLRNIQEGWEWLRESVNREELYTLAQITASLSTMALQKVLEDLGLRDQVEVEYLVPTEKELGRHANYVLDLQVLERFREKVISAERVVEEFYKKGKQRGVLRDYNPLRDFDLPPVRLFTGGIGMFRLAVEHVLQRKFDVLAVQPLSNYNPRDRRAAQIIWGGKKRDSQIKIVWMPRSVNASSISEMIPFLDMPFERFAREAKRFLGI